MSNLMPVPSNVTILQSVVKSQDSELAAYTNFLSNYIDKIFLSNLINCLVYQADLTLVLPSSNNIEIFKFLREFTLSLIQDLNISPDINVPKKHYFVLLSVLKQLIESKSDSTFSFIGYDTLLKHFNNITDQYVINILQDIADNPITDSTSFQKLFNDIIQDIQIYNQMKIIKSTLYRWDSFVKGSNSESNSESTSALNWVKNFKDTIIDANNSLTELTILKKNESVTDYLMFSDRESIKNSLSNILSFLKNSYRTFKTGYSLFDDNISGIESSSVSIISGPSNHAKSIFMLNIAKQMMENYNGDENDAFIFITLEDDINKLFRRILSIFGNYDAAVIKNVFTKASEILQNTKTTDVLGKESIDNISNILEDIAESSILAVTQGKKKFIIKHSSENSFSMSDATRFVDSLEISGLKVRGLFID